jgi:hypothetical protein
MAGERILSIKILGDASSGQKALKDIEGQSAKTTGSQKVLSGALADVRTKLLAVVPGGAQAETALKKMTGASEGTGLSMKGALVGGAAAGAVAIAALSAKGISQFANLTGEVTKLKNATGATSEESSKLVAVSHALGVDTEALTGSLFRSGAAIQQNADKFAAAGVNIATNRDGTVDLIGTLENAASAYQRTTDATEKDNIAKLLGGKRGLELIPILKAQRSQLDEIGKAAKNRGEIFHDDDLRQGVEFRKAMRELGEAGHALEISLAKGVVPALTGVTHGAADAVDAVNHLTSAVGGIGGIFKALTATSAFTAPKITIDSYHRLADAIGVSHRVQDDLGSHLPLFGKYFKDEADSISGVSFVAKALDGDLLGLKEREEAAAESAKSVAAATKAAADALSLGISAVQSLEQADQRVTETQKALTEAQGAGARKAKDIASANRDVSAATRSIAEAEQAVADARKQAPRDLVKAREDEAAAIHSVADADDDLAIAIAKYGVQSRQAADAQDQLNAARESQDEAKQKLADLQANPNKSIEDAEQRLADAKQSQLDAQEKLNQAKAEDPAAEVAKAEQDATDAANARQQAYDKVLTLQGSINTLLGTSVDLTNTTRANLDQIVADLEKVQSFGIQPFNPSPPVPSARGGGPDGTTFGTPTTVINNNWNIQNPTDPQGTADAILWQQRSRGTNF